MEIFIKNLRLKTIIGINDWERKQQQDVIINVALEINATQAAQSDRIEDTLNYKTLTKRIIGAVEASEFFLVEKLAHHILAIVLEDEKVIRGTVEVDKPQALSFADSVSVKCSGERNR
ncbi:MAG: dihydroneopterin aldolase [Deltaproteobacteria bacterium]|nr:dihydroneopterin aldolase [Deltaproteobacteria bacterium]